MRKLSFIIFVLSLFVIFAPVQSTFAQSTSSAGAVDRCTCFCKSSSGADEIGQLESDAMCDIACDALQKDGLGCFKSESEFPSANQQCWTQKDCDDHEILDEFGENVGTIWGGQRSECPAAMGHCYSKPISVRLGMAIDGTSSVSSIGEYIKLIYSFLIPAAALIAIVMIMIGGLQYMLARGDAGKITESKKRISNALIGMVLVLSAYTIANFIDPNLVSFNSLRTPIIRQITFLDRDSSCEALIEKGIDVLPLSSNEFCGAQGIIDSISGLTQGSGEDGKNKSITITSLKKGDKCQYFTCKDSSSACVQTADTENPYQCLSCTQVFDYNLNLSGATTNIEGLIPSERTCGKLVSPDKVKEFALNTGDNRKRLICEYDNNFANACVQVIYPNTFSQNVLDCGQLREYAANNSFYDSVGCRAYDLLGAKYAGGLMISGLSRNDGMIDSAGGADNAQSMFGSVCRADPCGLAPPGGQCNLFVAEISVADAFAAASACTAGVAVFTLGTFALPGAVACGITATLGATVGDEAIVNCANSDAENFGWSNCKDENGDPTSCAVLW